MEAHIRRRSRFGIPALVLLATAVAPARVPAQIAKILPVDEAAREPDFFAFRARLLVAVQERDTNHLYGILAEDIHNSFGGDGGVSEFKATWQPEQPGTRLWRTLTEILALGGQFQKPSEGYGEKMFVAPYVYSVRPAVAFDPWAHGVVIGRGVRVRERPTAASETLAYLAFDVVRVPDWQPRPDADGVPARTWIPVELADGRAGFVAAEYLRRATAHRAVFVLRDGTWLLKALVSGE
jgi:hypothetical protein